MRLRWSGSPWARAWKKFRASLDRAGLNLFFRRRIGNHWDLLYVGSRKRRCHSCSASRLCIPMKCDRRMVGGFVGHSASPALVRRSALLLPGMPWWLGANLMVRYLALSCDSHARRSILMRTTNIWFDLTLKLKSKLAVALLSMMTEMRQ